MLFLEIISQTYQSSFLGRSRGHSWEEEKNLYTMFSYSTTWGGLAVTCHMIWRMMQKPVAEYTHIIWCVDADTRNRCLFDTWHRVSFGRRHKTQGVFVLCLRQNRGVHQNTGVWFWRRHKTQTPPCLSDTRHRVSLCHIFAVLSQHIYLMCAHIWCVHTGVCAHIK